MSTTKLGELLRRERLRRGEYQSQAATRFNVTQPSYSRWENGQMWPDDKHFADIARYLGLDVEEVWQLVNGADPRPVTLDALKSEIAALQRDMTDLREQLAAKNTAI